jgi:hypothetical protein
VAHISNRACRGCLDMRLECQGGGLSARVAFISSARCHSISLPPIPIGR